MGVVDSIMLPRLKTTFTMWGIMAKKERHNTKYPGVYYVIVGLNNSKQEKVFYIRYRRKGRLIEEKAGSQSKDAMTAAKANNLRTDKIRGKIPSNNELRKQKRAELNANRNRWTINRLWQEYKNNKNPKTIDIDDVRFNKHIGPELGDKEPKELITHDITCFQNKLEKLGLKPGTVGRTLEILRRTINFGIKQELISQVRYKIKFPKVNDYKTEHLKSKEFRSLWKVLENEKNLQAANMMKLVLFTGLRRGELFKLKWEHIDFDNGFIKLVNPKGKVDQKIPLNQMARELLINHERPYPESPFVFPGKDGKQRTSIKKPVNRIRDEAGLSKDFRPLHGLRHTYATMLASSGKVDIYTLQKLLTHKDSRITQRYAHLVDKTLKRGADINADIITELVNKSDTSVDISS